jgi:hypothetical protein
LKEANIDSYLALNCALISDSTNQTIGRKDPLFYLKERYKWTTEEIVNERLNSHLIPVPELANGGYEQCESAEARKEKISKDFDTFIRKRASLIACAAKDLTEGKYISSTQILSSCNAKAN